jgi:hypothetical protein
MVWLFGWLVVVVVVVERDEVGFLLKGLGFCLLSSFSFRDKIRFEK